MEGKKTCQKLGVSDFWVKINLENFCTSSLLKRPLKFSLQLVDLRSKSWIDSSKVFEPLSSGSLKRSCSTVFR